LKTLHKALAFCEQFSLKHQRPDDYYAEMVKTDEHMLKLKDNLLSEQKRKDERNKQVKERQMKKFAKKVRRPLFSCCCPPSISLSKHCRMMTNLKQWESLRKNTCGGLFF